MYDYLLFLLLLVPFLALSGWASARVHSVYASFDGVPTKSHMTGYDTAVRLLRSRGIDDVAVGRVAGRLSDHFDPSKNTVNLSDATYGSDSVAAVAVAAHEIGHVVQRKRGYVPYRIRNVLVPIAQIGSRLALPLILLGILLDAFYFAAGVNWGQVIMYVGIALYGAGTLFMLVTLPVEYNASRRAREMLVSEGILGKEEVAGAKKVLSAAALTYVASMLVSLLYFLRFFLIVFTLGRRRN